MNELRSTGWSAAYFALGFLLISAVDPGKGQIVAALFFWIILPIAFCVGFVIALVLFVPIGLLIDRLPLGSIGKSVAFVAVSWSILVALFITEAGAPTLLPEEWDYLIIGYVFGFPLVFSMCNLRLWSKRPSTQALPRNVNDEN